LLSLLFLIFPAMCNQLSNSTEYKLKLSSRSVDFTHVEVFVSLVSRSNEVPRLAFHASPSTPCRDLAYMNVTSPPTSLVSYYIQSRCTLFPYSRSFV